MPLSAVFCYCFVSFMTIVKWSVERRLYTMSMFMSSVTLSRIWDTIEWEASLTSTVFCEAASEPPSGIAKLPGSERRPLLRF